MPQANAVFSDNVHGDYGAADCQNGDDCVEKVGDEAEVSWDIKLGSILNSNDHVQTSKGASIFVPQMVEDIKLEVTHSTDYEELEKEGSSYNPTNYSTGYGSMTVIDTFFPMVEHNPPVEMKEVSDDTPVVSEEWGRTRYW